MEKFKDGCYSLFKAKFIDNIAIVGGDSHSQHQVGTYHHPCLASSGAKSHISNQISQELLWVWLPLSWPSSSLLAALEKGTFFLIHITFFLFPNNMFLIKFTGWAIHHSMSNP